MALIIAISLLAIMSILGVILISSTTTEIQLTSNKRQQQDAFNTADRAIEYAMQRATFSEDPVDLYVDADTDTVLHRTRINLGNAELEPTANTSTVEFIGSGPPPPSFVSDVGEFKANYYVVSAVGISPAGSSNPSRTVIRAQVAKIIPK